METTSARAPLEGATLLIFADDWGIHPSSAQHLLARFLARNRVVWLNTVGQRLPRPTLRDARKLARKIGTWTRTTRTEPAKIDDAPRPEVVDLPLLPLALGPIARALNARVLRKAARSRLAAAGDMKAFIISTLPLTADLAGATPGATFVYYAVDDYASWPGVGNARLRRMDQEQASRADVVVAASRSLAAMYAPHARGEVAYLPHGVDVAHFGRARRLRDEHRSRGHAPLADVVFFGAIDERIDQRLLAQVVARRPGLRFLIVGPTDQLTPDLLHAGNLERRDAVSYRALPDLLACCRTTILPYVGGPFGERISPLKAREALAAGLPVVATDVPELRSLARGVEAADGPEAIAAALDRALAPDVDLPTLEDLETDSWEARAKRFGEILIAARMQVAAR